MPWRDWSSIEAAVEELAALVCALDAPLPPPPPRGSPRPQTLQRIERCVATLDAANVALADAFMVLMTARRFYAGGRACPHALPSVEAAQTRGRMRDCIANIRTDLAMLKRANGDTAE